MTLATLCQLHHQAGSQEIVAIPLYAIAMLPHNAPATLEIRNRHRRMLISAYHSARSPYP